MKMDDDEMMDEMVHDPKYVKHGDSNKEHKSHKMMTMDDVAECLEKDFADEISDSKKYMRMAHIAENAGAYEDSHYLLEMSKDEYTHATFIYDFMERHGICIPEDQEVCYHELKEEMAKFF